MLEIGVFHNGASDLPTIATPEGVVVNDGTLAEVHEGSQRTLINQIRQGILADRLGFNYFFMTEHHFQPEGAEFSPNPLLAETAPSTRRPTRSLSRRGRCRRSRIRGSSIRSRRSSRDGITSRRWPTSTCRRQDGVSTRYCRLALPIRTAVRIR